jgi:hypothetical protein
MAAVAIPTSAELDGHSKLASSKHKTSAASTVDGRAAAAADNAPAGNLSHEAAAHADSNDASPNSSSSSTSSTYPSIAARQALFYEGIEQVRYSTHR